MEFSIKHSPDKSIIVVEKNRLLGAENSELQSLVQESVEKGSKNIVVDLSKVEYIASWGIGILVYAYTTCNNKGIRFSLEGVNENVMSILDQLKLNKLFIIS